MEGENADFFFLYSDVNDFARKCALTCLYDAMDLEFTGIV